MKSTVRGQPGDRSDFLQIMRFVAAALVLVTHTTFYYHERISSSLVVWHPGEVGVLIFFVISGIVMVVSTENFPSNASGARTFMLRRLIRIAPLYWLATLLKLCVSAAQPGAVQNGYGDLSAVVQSLLFIPYFNERHFVWPLLGVGWTLLHEMFFYLLFSLALWSGRKPVVWVSAAIIGLFVAGQFLSLDRATWLIATSVNNLHFVVGMWVGSFMLRAKQNTGKGLNQGLAIAAIALTASGAQQAWWPFDRNFSLAVGFASLVLVCHGWSIAWPIGLLSRLGDSSYSLYLFHPFLAPAALLGLIKVWPSVPIPLHLAMTVTVTIVTAHLIHLFVEVPLFNRARRRLAHHWQWQPVLIRACGRR